MAELALGSAGLYSFTTLSLIGNFTSGGPSVPEEVPKHLRKLSMNMANDSCMLEETDSNFVVVVAVLPFQGQVRDALCSQHLEYGRICGHVLPVPRPLICART